MPMKNRPTVTLFIREAVVSDNQLLRFEWEGGQYITVLSRKKGYPSQQDDLWIDNATMRPPGWYSSDEVINVWDGDTGKPRIPFTKKGFDREVEKWISDNGWSTSTDN